MTETLLRVSELHKEYSTGGRTVEAIRRIDLSIGRGELVCIVGPSGCGKTTLLKCIAGLLTPTSGTVELEGAVVTAPPARMAVVFQEYGRSLFPWLTVRANIALPLRHKKLPRAERDRLVTEALAAVDLAGAASSYPWQLSGGMQQRVAIARAVAYQPEVLIMDEPFAAVDAQTRADLEDLVRRLHAEHRMSILFVTHDIDESVYLGDRVVVLSSSPTVVQREYVVDLPRDRDQIATRADARFTQLRTYVYEEIRRAKAERTGALAADPSHT